MKLNEQLSGPSGYLTIYKQEENGLKEKIFEEENLIVATGRTILLNQLYYSTGNGDPLSYAKIGKGGAIDINGDFLRVPTYDLVDLYDPVASVSIIKTEEDLTVPSITLVANVDNGVANGYYINEAGFFSTSGIMFNIKVFPRILKKSSFSLILEWKIKLL